MVAFPFLRYLWFLPNRRDGRLSEGEQAIQQIRAVPFWTLPEPVRS